RVNSSQTSSWSQAILSSNGKNALEFYAVCTVATTKFARIHKISLVSSKLCRHPRPIQRFPWHQCGRSNAGALRASTWQLTIGASMRCYVIGDIHGCLDELRYLIDGLPLESGDRLIFLGDYVDRGPNSKGVLTYILELQKQE